MVTRNEHNKSVLAAAGIAPVGIARMKPADYYVGGL